MSRGHVEFGVNADVIVKDVEIFVDVANSAGVGGEGVAEFLFETRETTFRNGIVPTVSFATHALEEAMSGQTRAERVGGVLNSTVRMEDAAGVGIS